jgi:hypothetical protein
LAAELFQEKQTENRKPGLTTILKKAQDIFHAENKSAMVF